jgi:putative ABC transport system permease protein
MLTIWIGAIDMGLAYAGLALGVYLTLRVLNFADITVDGSFALGGGSAALLLSEQVAPPLALLAAVALGALAGTVTGLIHTRLGVNDLFAGILTTTGLYSITLRLMGRSNIPLTDLKLSISQLPQLGFAADGQWLIALLLVAVGLIALLALWLATDLGLALRAITGLLPMARANGISTRRGLTLGIAVGNGLVALAGALVALYQGFADVTMGIGSLILGLGAVIVGESVLRPRTVPMALLAVVLGSVLFRAMIALALQLGMDPVDLKLATALLLLAALGLGRLRIPGVADPAGREAGRQS